MNIDGKCYRLNSRVLPCEDISEMKQEQSQETVMFWEASAGRRERSPVSEAPELGLLVRGGGRDKQGLVESS